MTNEELEIRFERLVKTERKITLEVLRLISEAERRKHYLERGFGSIYEWLTRGHGYSQPAANRRIQAARLLSLGTPVEQDVASGAINLSIMALTGTAFRQEERRTKEKIPASAKVEILSAMAGKSFESAEKILRERYPLSQKKEVLRSINGKDSRLALNLTEESLKNLTRARELLSHVIPTGSWSEVVAYLAKDFVKRKKPKKKSESATDCVKPTNSTTCEFRDEKTGRICGSRYQVQDDHIIPRALGGTDAPGNFRKLCRKHNLYEAERLLGKEVMARFRRG